MLTENFISKKELKKEIKKRFYYKNGKIYYKIDFRKKKAHEEAGFNVKGRLPNSGTVRKVSLGLIQVDIRRVSYILNFGDIPDGYMISTKDENPINVHKDNLLLLSKEEGRKRVADIANRKVVQKRIERQARPLLQAVEEDFSYDPISGNLIRKDGKWQGRKVGSEQLNSNGHRYKVIRIGRRTISVGIIVWMLHNKKVVPEGHCISYKDKNRLNTRIENLALLKKNVLTGNLKKEKTSVTTPSVSTELPRGIIQTGAGRYSCVFLFNGKKIQRGNFPTLEEALLEQQLILESLEGLE